MQTETQERRDALRAAGYADHCACMTVSGPTPITSALQMVEWKLKEAGINIEFIHVFEDDDRAGFDILLDGKCVLGNGTSCECGVSDG